MAFCVGLEQSIKKSQGYMYSFAAGFEISVALEIKLKLRWKIQFYLEMVLID